MEFVDLKRQYALYKKEIDAGIHEVLDSGCYIMGPKITEIEELLARFVAVDHCITVSSGTDSLLIALMALGVGPGDEVITTPFSWISTIEVIALVGATPVLVDIEPDSFNIDPEKIEEKISKRTKAIIAVSLFGQMADFKRINAIAEKHQIAVIEDGAQSFGAEQEGRKSCGVTTIGSTSFFPTKPLGCCGDGGALFTNDQKLADRMRAIRTHGGIVRDQHECIGLNGRFDPIQAVVLLAKFPHLMDELAARRRIGAHYNQLLGDVDCETPVTMSGNHHIYGVYTIRLKEREQIAQELNQMGIPVRVYYPTCFHQMKIFECYGFRDGMFPEAERASREVLALPMHPWITLEDQMKVAEALKELTSQFSTAGV